MISLKKEPEKKDIVVDYNATQPLLPDAIAGKKQSETIFAENEQRFNNTTKYSDQTIDHTKAKDKEVSRLIKALSKRKITSFLVGPATKIEKSTQKILSNFRFDALFYAQKTPIYVLNLFLFFAVYSAILYLFFNGRNLSLSIFKKSYLLLPIFLIGLDLFYHLLHKKFKKGKEPSYLLSKNFGYWSAMIILIGILATIPYIGLDVTFSAKTHRIMQIFTSLVIISFAVLCYYTTRKHFLATLVMFITFYSVSSQPVTVINWNDNFKDESTTYKQISLLSYNLYTARASSAIEEINPYSFIKIETKNKKGNWSLFVDVVYTYQLSHQVVEKIKNAKCLTNRYHYCDNSSNAPKFIINAKDERYINNLKDFKTYLHFTLNRVQTKFINELEFTINLPFNAKHYINDLNSVYNIHLTRQYDGKPSIQEQIGLGYLDTKVENMVLGETFVHQ